MTNHHPPPHVDDDNPLPIVDDRPTRADAVKNRQLLLDTARQMFNQKGVDQVSMTAIADAAEVGKGTLYRHFKNKGDLCRALIDHEQARLQTQTLERLQQSNHPQADLRWFLAEAAQFVIDNLDFLLVHVDDYGPTDLTHPAHIWWRQTIRGLLARLRLTLDLDYVADILYVMLHGSTIAFQLRVLGYSPDRIIAGLLDTCDRLIGAAQT